MQFYIININMVGGVVFTTSVRIHLAGVVITIFLFPRNPRLLKVESYESGDTLRANSLRLSVSKSHSFNGYEPQQQMGQQVSQQQAPPTRVLTKQGSNNSFYFISTEITFIIIIKFTNLLFIILFRFW